MSISLVGFTWSLIMIMCMVKGRKAYLELMLVSLIFQCDNFLVIGEVGVGIHLMTIAVGLFVFMPQKQNFLWLRKEKNKSLSALKVSFILLFIIVMISLLKNQVGFNIIHIAMLLSYIILLIELYSWRGILSAEDISKMVKVSVYIVTAIGILQVLEKSGVAFLNGALRTFVYNDVDNYTVCFNNKPTNAFYSAFMEPSYCGAFLVSCFGFLALQKKESQKDVLWLIVIVIEIVMTRSSTAYIGFAIALVLLSIIGKNKSVIGYAFPVLALLIILFVVFENQLASQMLNETIFDKASSGSYRVRSFWNERAINNFHMSPIFGIGYKQSRASSFLLTMLAETGILGLICIAIQFFVFAVNSLFSSSNIIKQTSVFVLIMYICQFIAVPDLVFSPLWFGLFLYVLANNQNRINNGQGRHTDENRNTNF